MAQVSDAAEALARSVEALRTGQVDEAVARLEAMADHDLVGSGVAFDRGLAYFTRARSGQGQPGDLGRAAHAFEEALRRDPWDSEAAAVLDAVRRDIAGRGAGARAAGRIEEVGATPLGRSLLVAAPSDVWMGLTLGASLVLAVALAIRPLLDSSLRRGARLVVSTIAIIALVVMAGGTALTLGARAIRLGLHEAVVVVLRAPVTPEGMSESAFELEEGTRVDVLEERATAARISTDRGSGWISREALRMLPAWRP